MKPGPAVLVVSSTVLFGSLPTWARSNSHPELASSTRTEFSTFLPSSISGLARPFPNASRVSELPSPCRFRPPRFLTPWPGRDICGQAPTGSGKTLAFGIPLVTNATGAKPGQPRALVLVPTRELAEQVREVLASLLGSQASGSPRVYGGTGYGPQRQALRRGADIVVACPGRLEDLVDAGVTST